MAGEAAVQDGEALSRALAAVGDDAWPTIAAQPCAPGPILETLCAGETRSLVAANPACPASLLPGCGADPDWRVRYSLATNPRCPAALLIPLARDRQADVRRAVAANDATSSASLDVLLAELDVDQADNRAWHLAVARAVAANAGAGAGHLARLYGLVAGERFDDTLLAMRIARHPATDPAALRDLAAHSDERVSAGAVGNPQCPVAVVRAAATGTSLTARSAIANPRLGGGPLLELAGHPHPAVRAAVAANTSAEAALLHRLLADPHPDVQAALARRSKNPATLRLFALDVAAVVYQIATNPHCPSDVLESIASGHAGAIIAAAGHPNTAAVTLQGLAAHRSPLVRRGVAANPHTPAAALAALTADADRDVVRHLLHNPALLSDLSDRHLRPTVGVAL